MLSSIFCCKRIIDTEKSGNNKTSGVDLTLPTSLWAKQVYSGSIETNALAKVLVNNRPNFIANTF